MTHYSLYIKILFTVLVGMLGIGTTIAGYLGVQRRRPFYLIHQGRLFVYYLILFILWTLYFASLVIHILEVDNESISFGIVFVVVLLSALPAFLLGVLPRLWRSKSSSSTIILGINKTVLDLMRQALEKEGIAYDEAYEDFTLPELKSRIYTTIWSGIGYASLKIDPKVTLPVLEKIIHFMKEYDKGHTDHFSLKFMILLILCGLLMAGIGIFLAYSFVKIVIV